MNDEHHKVVTQKVMCCAGASAAFLCLHPQVIHPLLHLAAAYICCESPSLCSPGSDNGHPASFAIPLPMYHIKQSKGDMMFLCPLQSPVSFREQCRIL